MVTSVTAGISENFLIVSQGLAVILVLPGASAPAGPEEGLPVHASALRVKEKPYFFMLILDSFTVHICLACV